MKKSPHNTPSDALTIDFRQFNDKLDKLVEDMKKSFKSDAKAFIGMADKEDLEEMKEMIEDRMNEETTYIVVCTRGGADEWVHYEGFSEDAARAAYEEQMGRGEKGYSCEIRVMSPEYNLDESAYNYELLEV